MFSFFLYYYIFCYMYTSAWWITTSYSSCTNVAAYNDSLLLYSFLELLEWWYNFCLHILQIDDLYHNSAWEYYCNTALLIRKHCTLGLISVYDTENFNQALTSQVPLMPHIKNKVSPEAGQVGESVHCELIWVFLPLFRFYFKRSLLSWGSRKASFVLPHPRLLWPFHSARVFFVWAQL